MLYQWFPGLPETAFGTHDFRGRCQVRGRSGRPLPCPAIIGLQGRIATASPAFCCTKTVVQTEANLVRRRNQPSVADEMKRLDKACATQSDSCASPPYTYPLKIGCRAQNPQRVTFTAITPLSVARCDSRLGFRNFATVRRISRGTARRPEWLAGGGDAAMGTHPRTRLLLAALGNIAAFIKCFNCLKIVIIRG